MVLDIFYKELDALFQTKNVRQTEKYILNHIEKALAENDLAAMFAMFNELGGIYRVTGRFEEAKKIYETAIDLVREIKLEGSYQHGTTLQNLGSVLSESGDPAGALKIYSQAEAIYRSLGLEKDYRFASLNNNMSHALERMDLLDEAVAHAERALSIIRLLSGNDVELATTYTTLASRYIKKQKYADAENYLKQAEQIFLAMPGKADVHFAATLNTMGELHFLKRDFASAVSSFEKALDIVKASYGETKIYNQITKNLEQARASMIRPREHMAGMALAEDYFETYGKPMIRNDFADYESLMAIGLVGEGSECFGYDDEYSTSHDFGPGFCIWLQDEVFKQIGAQLQKAYDSLPKTHKGYTRSESLEGGGRVGVFSIQQFYKKYIGCAGVPQNHVEWLFTPETSLATVTNGKVFADPVGGFTKIRKELHDFYPEDIRLKKIAARMAMMSQTGQYNYGRCMDRGEYEAAYMACTEFIKTTVSMVYLLNRKYMPFYKWMFRGMDRLEILREVKPMLSQLAKMPDTKVEAKAKIALIEEICIFVLKELTKQGILCGTDPFLNNHARDVLSLITDPQIRSLPVMFDGR